MKYIQLSIEYATIPTILKRTLANPYNLHSMRVYEIKQDKQFNLI